MKKKLTLFAMTALIAGAVHAQYCTQNLHNGVCGPEETGITKVESVAMSLNINLGSCAPGLTPYFYYTAAVGQAGIVTAGNAYNMKVTIPTLAGFAPPNVDLAIWIDWNDNKVFDASEFQIVPTSNHVQGVVNATVSVPNNQPSDTVRVRIRNLLRFANVTAYSAASACVLNPGINAGIFVLNNGTTLDFDLFVNGTTSNLQAIYGKKALFQVDQNQQRLMPINNEEERGLLTVTQVDGKVIYTSSQLGPVDYTMWSPGVYIARYEASQGILTQRFVK